MTSLLEAPKRRKSQPGGFWGIAIAAINFVQPLSVVQAVDSLSCQKRTGQVVGIVGVADAAEDGAQRGGREHLLPPVRRRVQHRHDQPPQCRRQLRLRRAALYRQLQKVLQDLHTSTQVVGDGGKPEQLVEDNMWVTSEMRTTLPPACRKAEHLTV